MRNFGNLLTGAFACSCRREEADALREVLPVGSPPYVGSYGNLSNGGHYSGVTTATLTVTSADSNDVANYRCVVTDANGSTASSEAALSLKAATTITQQPANATVFTGGTTNFTVAATGDR